MLPAGCGLAVDPYHGSSIFQIPQTTDGLARAAVNMRRLVGRSSEPGVALGQLLVAEALRDHLKSGPGGSPLVGQGAQAGEPRLREQDADSKAVVRINVKNTFIDIDYQERGPPRRRASSEPPPGGREEAAAATEAEGHGLGGGAQKGKWPGVQWPEDWPVAPPPLPYFDAGRALAGSPKRPYGCAGPGDEAPAVSAGSRGHPRTCASPCKYVRKKTGCRDGAACPKCHQCPYRRQPRPEWPLQVLPAAAGPRGVAGRAEDQWQQHSPPGPLAVAAPGSPRSPPIVMTSLGSVGHPYKCAQACRYVWRKSGCREGAACPCCHLCRWSRAAQGFSAAGLPAAAEDAWGAADQPPPPPPQPWRPPPPSPAPEAPSTAAAAAAMVAWSGGSRSIGSRGSLGHPHACAKACKYASKASGCKDGLACARCHLCRWTRSCGYPPAGVATAAGAATAAAR